MILEVNNGSFEKEVLECQCLVLVEFHASWSGVCKALTPILDDICEKYKDRLKVTRVFIDESPQLAEDYRVKAYPTLMMFKDGRILEQMVGLSHQDEIQQFIEKCLTG